MKLARLVPQISLEARESSPSKLADKKESLIAALYNGQLMEAALRQSGLGARDVRSFIGAKSRQHDEAFTGAFVDAMKAGAELRRSMLEQQCDRLAYEGWLVPVYQLGRLAGFTRRYSTRLAILMTQMYGGDLFAPDALKLPKISAGKPLGMGANLPPPSAMPDRSDSGHTSPVPRPGWRRPS